MTEPSLPSRIQVEALLARFGRRLEGRITHLAAGTLNLNLRVTAGDGDWVLRRYRDDLETGRIVGEHALTDWVADRDIPAPRPQPLPAGGSLVIDAEDGRWALFPFVDGANGVRGGLTPAEVRQLGALHGRVQATLATHPESREAPMLMRWDRAQSLHVLALVRATARERGADAWLVAGLERQTAMLEAMDVRPPEAFAGLPCQLLHGDFHDQQVLWRGGRIAALLDWEIWHTDPRAWELVRSLAFSLLLESPRLDDYLAGYRDHVRLTEEEVRLALDLWWQSRVVGTWAWAAHFLHGNERVAAFFPNMLAELDLVASPTRRSSIEANFLNAARG